MPAHLATASEIVPLIVFTLDGHAHAIETASVQEVLRMVAITAMPEAPPWVAGMINLRGRPTVVVDLRLRFGLGSPQRGLATPIIIARTSGAAIVGLIVDSITELHDLPRDGFFDAADGGLVTAVARIGPRLVRVADVDAIAGGAEQLIPVAE